jgi:hypothetical protein
MGEVTAVKFVVLRRRAVRGAEVKGQVVVGVW